MVLFGCVVFFWKYLLVRAASYSARRCDEYNHECHANRLLTHQRWVPEKVRSEMYVVYIRYYLIDKLTYNYIFEVM